MSLDDRKQTVGFVGLGQMGAPMAENILKKGHRLVAYDIEKRKVEHAVSRGAQAASSPADTARRASTLISMVDTTAQAEEVIVGPGGFIEAAQPGDVIISMSTIDLTALRRLQPKLTERRIDLLDAPVTGMETGAKAGTLRAYVGGDAAALERVRPVLQAMTSEITHFGALGQGIAMKLVNNMLMQVNRVLIAEALALGAKAGLDPKQMVDTISKTTGNSVAFQYSAPRILARDFDGIRMEITCKDVELQVALAKSLGMPMFMASMALRVYEMGKAMGLGGKDAASIVTLYEQWTGVPVVPRA
jgi:3-hydroxyisobutyrate dehydrogenase-like beta-hydroxyacid dehydrogenase